MNRILVFVLLFLVSALLVYYFTESWQFSLILVGLPMVQIFFDLGLSFFIPKIDSEKSKKEDFEKLIKENKKRMENNPTLK